MQTPRDAADAAAGPAAAPPTGDAADLGEAFAAVPVQPETGMGSVRALRAEFAIIGLGVLALVMIFQPFSLALYGIGCGLVVVAGLVNNLLPFAQPRVPMRALVRGAIVVAVVFVVVLAISLASAYLYGQFFVRR
ncbi:MAG TPA: hypothetical protein VMU33_12295 [Burkholderiaceae bacterium]|nr:hypothetical protein [Burkholderiaceae bacterium]